MNGAKLMALSRTVWVNVLTFLIAFLGLIEGQEWIKANPEWVAAIGMAVGVLNIILRRLTDRAVVVWRPRRSRFTH